MPNKKRRVTTMRYSYYNLVIKYLVEKGLDLEYVMPGKSTRNTEKIGDNLAPDYVCTPFKTMLGSEVEAIERGADTLVVPHGICRLGYFGEPSNNYFKEMGYEVDMVNLQEYYTGRNRDWLKLLRRLNPHYSKKSLAIAARDSYKMTTYLDEIVADYYRDAAFYKSRRNGEEVLEEFFSNMEGARDLDSINEAYQKAKVALSNLPQLGGQKRIRVDIVGEFYTAMDAFSNRNVEDKLVDLGLEVHRDMNMTNRMFRAKEEKLLPYISEYCTYTMGPTSTLNIYSTKKRCEEGFDGIIHIKGANCTPEIDLVPILRTVCNDYKVPFLTLTFDSQVSDTGLNTRLEAFFDMMEAKANRRERVKKI